MNKNKCNICGKYESRPKELKNGKCKLLSEIYGDFNIPVIHYWKWCKIHNNWCRCVAGKCGEVVSGKEKKLELENVQGLGFKMTMVDEL